MRASLLRTGALIERVLDFSVLDDKEHQGIYAADAFAKSAAERDDTIGWLTICIARTLEWRDWRLGIVRTDGESGVS